MCKKFPKKTKKKQQPNNPKYGVHTYKQSCPLHIAPRDAILVHSAFQLVTVRNLLRHRKQRVSK